MTETVLMLFGSHTFRTVSLGAATIGAVAGVLGCFAYLQHQTLAGGVVAHSSLSGITFAFLVSFWWTGVGSISTAVLLPGAFVAGLLSMLLARSIVRLTPLRIDTAMAVSMSLFFGGGFFLLRIINVRSIPGRIGLDGFLFGQAALMTRSDLRFILAVAALVGLVTVLFWKEYKISVFDPGFAAGAGFRVTLIDTLLLLSTVIAVVLGLRSVGVVLMVALLAAPAGAARQWTKRLSSMALLAAVFGAVSGFGGAVVSALYTRIPTGPVIVIIASFITVFSVLAGPRRGVVAILLRNAMNRRRFTGKLYAELGR